MRSSGCEHASDLSHLFVVLLWARGDLRRDCPHRRWRHHPWWDNHLSALRYLCFSL